MTTPGQIGVNGADPSFPGSSLASFQLSDWLEILEAGNGLKWAKMVVDVVSKVPNLQGIPRSTASSHQHHHHGPLHVQPGAGDHEVEAAGVGDDPAAASLQPLHPLPPAAAVRQ